MSRFVRKTKEERMQEIKTAAMNVFLDRGYAATTMDHIVDSVEMSKGSVYRYYSSKRKIIIDLLTDGIGIRNSILSQYSISEDISYDTICDIFVDLLFNENADVKYAKLYVVFLYEKVFDKDLEQIYRDMMSYEVKDDLYLKMLFHRVGEQKFIRIVMVFNMFVLGKYILHPSFQRNMDKMTVKNILLDILHEQ